jgi:hypothetical protein
LEIKGKEKTREKETVKDILRKHDLEKAELILRKQLDQEEKEREMRKLNPNYEPPKPPRPPAKRKMTKWIGAKLGRNQQLILQLLRERKDKPKKTLQLEFTAALYPDGVSLENRKKAKMLFDQALRLLKRRQLIKTTCPVIVRRGRKATIVELTGPARDFAFYRKPLVLENLVIKLLNEKIAAKQQTVKTGEILNALSEQGVGGQHINPQKIGIILGKYLVRIHTEKGSLYHLFSVPIPLHQKPKKNKRNWKRHPRYIETGMGVIRVG